MKIVKKKRKYKTGIQKILIKDSGSIFLNLDEMVTFKDKDGSQYDVGKKNWGYYATPSINSRLIKFGFQTALIKNKIGRYFIFLIKKNKKKEFKKYIKLEENKLICYLNNRSSIKKIERIFNET